MFIIILCCPHSNFSKSWETSTSILRNPNSKIKTFEKKSGDLKYFQKIFRVQILTKIFSSNYASFWWSSKFYSFQSIKTSKMFQNLKSGDLLNFPQKSSGSDLTPSKMFHVSSKYYYSNFKSDKKF
jgi:hypothetical protein